MELEWSSLREESASVSDSLTATSALCLPWCQHRFLDPNFCHGHIFSFHLLSLFFFLLPLCLLLMDKRKNIFPGNLLYLQSSDMAARPLLINSPLNFNRLIINYWGINVQIQLCCPSSVHKCQQRYFMAYAVEHSNSQSPLTLTSQLFEAEKRGLFKLSMQTEQERRRNLS